MSFWFRRFRSGAELDPPQAITAALTYLSTGTSAQPLLSARERHARRLSHTWARRWWTTPVHRHFGQGRLHTCGLACVRYLKWHFDRKIRHEQELPTGLASIGIAGSLASQMEQFVRGCGYHVPEVVVKNPRNNDVGPLAPHVPVQELTKGALDPWLRKKADRTTTVLALLNTAELVPYFYPVGWGNPHWIVVLRCNRDWVVYLDPCPPPDKAIPKRGGLTAIARDTFLNAWWNSGGIGLCCAKS